MKKILSYILACLPMMFLLAGCSETDNYLSSSSMRVTVTAQMPEADTRVDLSQEENTLNLITKWQTDDEMRLIIVQGDQKFELGKVPLSNISSDGRSASFSYILPSDLNTSKSYQLYAFCGIEGYVDKKQERSNFFHSLSLLKTTLLDCVKRMQSCNTKNGVILPINN